MISVYQYGGWLYAMLLIKREYDVDEYDKRTPDLSNAALHMK